MANVKSHFSVPYTSSHYKPSQALFKYVLTYILAQIYQEFVMIAWKDKCSNPDMPSLKEAIQNS